MVGPENLTFHQRRNVLIVMEKVEKMVSRWKIAKHVMEMDRLPEWNGLETAFLTRQQFVQIAEAQENQNRMPVQLATEKRKLTPSGIFV